MFESDDLQRSCVDPSALPSLTEWKESPLYSSTSNSDDSCEKLYEEVFYESISSSSLENDLPADSLTEYAKSSDPHWVEEFETLKPNITSSKIESDSNTCRQEPSDKDESEIIDKVSEVAENFLESKDPLYCSIPYHRDAENADMNDVYKDGRYEFVRVLPPSLPPEVARPAKINSADGLNKMKHFFQKGVTENSKKKKQQKKWQMFRKSVSSIFIDPPDILAQQFIRDSTLPPAPSTDENRNSWSKTAAGCQPPRPSPNQTLNQNMPATIGSYDDQPCEDKYGLIANQGSNDFDDYWRSDEFDSSSFSDNSEEDYATKPLPPLPSKKLSTDASQAPRLIEKIRNLTSKEKTDSDDDSLCVPVAIRKEKLRTPHLPPAPTNLTCNQIKRRCIVEFIILSEKSYIESLEQIIEEYEEPILQMVGVQKLKIANSFKKLREILNYHHMFQIELAERVNCWDEKETIGGIFLASFSKSMVFNAYSIYVNNFSVTMEAIKNLQRTRQFREFFKQKEMKSRDRLSIFGLMVKPIQRFPQFIMCLQDLLKYTPKEHVDRRDLQLAVTALENLAHKLNEHKRENEQNFAAQQILMKIQGLTKPNLTSDNKFLIRQDDMLHIVNQAQPTKSKNRRVFMLNDMLICVNVLCRERDGEVTERYKHKWTFPLKNVELKVNSSIADVCSSLSLWTGESISSMKTDSIEDDSQEAYQVLSDMNHDYKILEDISKLVGSLKCSYEVLTEELLHEMQRDLRFKIQDKHEQISLLDGCSIELLLPDKAGNVLLQASSPSAKQNWCLDFQIAKLALSPQNQPGWDIPPLHNTDRLKENVPAYFVSSLPIDVSTHSSQVECAVGVYLPSGHMGVPHVWVCNTVPEVGGQVSIISVQTSQNILTLTESFQATSTEITCVEKVPGTGCLGTTFSSVDTVWMATVDQKMYVYGLHNPKGNQRKALKVFPLSAVAQCLRYSDDKIFAALDSGLVLIFKRQKDEERSWDIANPEIVKLDEKPVTCLLESPSDGCILAASSNTIFVINQDTGLCQSSHKLSGSGEVEHIVPTGVGLWVSYKNSSIIHLYHIENLELLQEINVSSAGTRVSQADCVKECSVTCLLASRGMLWIGTNVGLLLSFPLPRLRDGVPTVSGRPYVSYHGHTGAIKFLLPFTSAFRTKGHLQSSMEPQKSEDDEDVFLKVESIRETDLQSDEKETERDEMFHPDEKHEICSSRVPLFDQLHKELNEKLAQRYRSAPNLLDLDENDNVQSLYGSLMHGMSQPLSRTQSLMKRSPKHDGSLTPSLGTMVTHVSSPTIIASGHTAIPCSSLASIINNNLDSHVESKSEKSNPEIVNNKNLVKCKTKQNVSMTSNPSFSYPSNANNNNSTIIVSGGNGYRCWNDKRVSNSDNKDNDASLLFWIYKQ